MVVGMANYTGHSRHGKKLPKLLHTLTSLKGNSKINVCMCYCCMVEAVLVQDCCGFNVKISWDCCRLLWGCCMAAVGLPWDCCRNATGFLHGCFELATGLPWKNSSDRPPAAAAASNNHHWSPPSTDYPSTVRLAPRCRGIEVTVTPLFDCFVFLNTELPTHVTK